MLTYHHEKILRFDITMGYSFLVTIQYGLKENLTDSPGLSLRINFLVADSRQEISTPHFFHDHKTVVTLVENIV